jgi:uncharacterized membrane protein
MLAGPFGVVCLNIGNFEAWFICLGYFETYSLDMGFFLIFFYKGPSKWGYVIFGLFYYGAVYMAFDRKTPHKSCEFWTIGSL